VVRAIMNRMRQLLILAHASNLPPFAGKANWT
jgi:hypothetical protein